MILDQYRGVHCVDLGESFQTHIYLQNLASIPPRTSPVKFAGSRDSWRPSGAGRRGGAPRFAPRPPRAAPGGRCSAFFKNAFFENAFFENAFFENFANFWRARSRLYQNEILQENMRLTAFFKLYKICILLHRCNLKFFAKNRFEKLRISQNF